LLSIIVHYRPASVQLRPVASILLFSPRSPPARSALQNFAPNFEFYMRGNQYHEKYHINHQPLVIVFSEGSGCLWMVAGLW
jgi:hypothetical protein